MLKLCAFPGSYLERTAYQQTTPCSHTNFPDYGPQPIQKHQMLPCRLSIYPRTCSTLHLFPPPSSTANVHAPPQPCCCRWFRLHTPGPGLLHVRCPLDTQLPIYGSIGGQVKLSKVKDNTSPSLWVIIGHIVHI